MPPVNYHDNAFPPRDLDYARLIPLIGPVTLALGDFKGTLDVIPNPHILLSPLAAREAVLSSRIEGTQATLEEVLEYEAGGDQPDSQARIDDIHEVINYRNAILDGNGRLGRMIIPLYLFERKMLSHPSFYLSEYLEAHRDEYYERLRAVSRDGDWTGWTAFFLEAMKKQALENTRKSRAIMKLYEHRKQWMIEQTHSRYAVPALDFFFRRPIFRSDQFWKSGEIPDQTARAILRTVRDELLVALRPASGRRAAVYAYSELLNIAEGREAF